MGHDEMHDYLRQSVAFGFAALIPLAALVAIACAFWEAHRRKRGKPRAAVKPGSPIAARFAPVPE